jgi:hypothetical protein
MDSPLAASRLLAYRRRTRIQPRESGRRIVGMVGTLLVHVVFLLVFVLGPAYEVELPPEPTEKALRVRLIDAPEPPPPPPVRGTPPKEIGPRHQARARAAPRPSVRHATANTAAPALARVSEAPAAPAPAVVSPPVQARAPTPQKPAAPKPPVSLPTPAPTPDLQPIPLAAEPPSVALPRISLQPPVPPKFQPQVVRQPQPEGTRPMPPPASLALPPLPAQAPPPVTAPSIALDVKIPRSTEAPSVQPIRATVSAAPPVPELQAVPLPAQAAPQVNLQASFNVPTPIVRHEAPRIEAPAIEVAEAQLDAVPQTPLARPAVAPPEALAVTVQDTPKAMTAIEPPVLARPQLSEQPAPEAASAEAADVVAPAAPTATADASPSEAKPADADAADRSAPPGVDAGAASQADADHDVSTAPDASAQGSDTARPGAPEGATHAVASGSGAPAPSQAQGPTKTATGTGRGAGEQGADQAGAAQGEKEGALGDYVQLKPRGNTDVMTHRPSGITYKATALDKYWAPKNESSIDTALRRAVEKTTVKHTFNLPQGIRVECSASPLLPIALLGCGNPDPPAKPLGQEMYRRLNLPSTAAGVPSVPAPATSTPRRAVVFTNDAECAAARVAGGPLPPGCESAFAPVAKPAAPARSSSSWVPASDQFH